MLLEFPAPDPSMAILGRRLREVRLARGLDQAELATAANVPKIALALAEQGRGRLTSSELHRLTNALHLSMTYLQSEGFDPSRLRRLGPQ